MYRMGGLVILASNHLLYLSICINIFICICIELHCIDLYQYLYLYLFAFLCPFHKGGFVRVSSGLGAHFLSRSQHSGASDKPIALCEVLPLPLSFNHFQYGSLFGAPFQAYNERLQLLMWIATALLWQWRMRLQWDVLYCDVKCYIIYCVVLCCAVSCCVALCRWYWAVLWCVVPCCVISFIMLCSVALVVSSVGLRTKGEWWGVRGRLGRTHQSFQHTS